MGIQNKSSVKLITWWFLKVWMQQKIFYWKISWYICHISMLQKLLRHQQLLLSLELSLWMWWMSKSKTWGHNPRTDGTWCLCKCRSECDRRRTCSWLRHTAGRTSDTRLHTHPDPRQFLWALSEKRTIVTHFMFCLNFFRSIRWIGQ